MKKIKSGIVLDAAVHVALRDGFTNLTREAVAVQAAVSTGAVSSTYGTMCKLKRAVMRHAVKHELLDIIASGLGIQHPVAMKAPDNVKKMALEKLL